MTQLALDVHLGRRFREREIARPETRFRLAEEFVGEMRQRRFEVDEANSLVNGESFDLSKHWGMRRIEKIAAVCVPGTKNPDRRLELLHRPDLHGRRVCSQQRVFAKVQCVV